MCLVIAADKPEDDFVLTPEVRAAIREGQDDVAAGRTVGMEEALRDLATFKRKWAAMKQEGEER